MPHGEKEYLVEVPEEGRPKPRRLKIVIKWAADVSITELMEFLK